MIKILLTFLIVKINRNNFIKNFITVCFFLTVISLVGYILQIFIPDILFQINNWNGLDVRNNSNSLLFNFTYLHPMRNSGCMWEPGAFAALLVIALLFIDFFNNEKRTREKVIISIGILTTISTNGYLLLALIYLFSFLNKSKGKMKILGFFLFFPVGFYTFYNAQIFSSKIGNQLIGIEEEVDKAFQNPNYVVSVTRFSSFIVDFPTFLERPILGYGVDIQTTNKKSMYKTYGENVVRSSGLMTLLLSFGLFGSGVYLWLLYKNFLQMSKNKLIAFFSTLLILCIIFSNPLEFSPLILCLFFVKSTYSNNFAEKTNKRTKTFV